MLTSYLKIGLRNLLRHKSHSVINVVGLAAGLTCCLFIALYVTDELSYDRYHEKADRIYRITLEEWAKMPAAFAPAMKQTYPQIVEHAARLWPLFAPAKVRNGDVVFVERGGVFADGEVFSVFSWPMLSGNPSTALEAPNSIVFTESLARKYFGFEEPMGKTVQFWGQNMTITGIVRDIPSKSHIQFDFLVSFPTLNGVMGKGLEDNWGMPVFYTYILSHSGTSSADIGEAAKKLIAPHSAGIGSQPVVQPLTDIHLFSHLEGELTPGGNVGYLYALTTAAFIVLLLACINFANLATARAATRTKEVGIRKVMGSMRSQLIMQFFGEALIISLVATIIAVTTVSATLPAFQALSGKTILTDDLFRPAMMGGVFVVMLGAGLAAGAYPALYLSRFKPANILKGSVQLPGSNLLLKKGLIVFQFAMSTVFLIGLAIVILQLDYLQSRSLGYDKDQIIVLDGDNFPLIAQQLKGVAGVEHVAGIPQVFGGPLPMSPYKAERVYTDSLSQMRHYGVTREYVETMGLQLVAGRSFIETPDESVGTAFILSESAVRHLGWEGPEDAVGRSFAMSVPPLEGGNDVWREGTVVGVARDFHFEPLYRNIEPIVLYPSADLNLTLVRVSSVSAGIIGSVKAVWDKVNPDAPFNYYFLNDHISRQYESEQKLGRLMAAATILAVVIACLGLFALVSFSAARRVREIGIRKVLGASVSQIFGLLSFDLMKLVVLGVALALPIAYLCMARWLNDFAYHVELSWPVFAGVSLLAMLLALITVGFRAVSAAQADPVESIKTE